MTVLDDNPLLAQQAAQVVAQVRPAGEPVVPADGQREAVDRPAPATSPLAAIRARVKAAREAAAYRDLRVPGLGNPAEKWDPEAVFVRYRMLTGAELNTIADRNAGLSGWQFQWSNSVQLLFKACLGMFSVDADGYPVGSPSSWPRFGQEMAAEAGLDIDGSGDAAGALLREFYVAEIDVVRHAEEVLRLSQRDNGTQERALPEG